MFYHAKQNTVYLEDKLNCLQYRISQLAIKSSTKSLAKVIKSTCERFKAFARYHNNGLSRQHFEVNKSWLIFLASEL